MFGLTDRHRHRPHPAAVVTAYGGCQILRTPGDAFEPRRDPGIAPLSLVGERQHRRRCLGRDRNHPNCSKRQCEGSLQGGQVMIECAHILGLALRQQDSVGPLGHDRDEIIESHPACQVVDANVTAKNRRIRSNSEKPAPDFAPPRGSPAPPNPRDRGSRRQRRSAVRDRACVHCRRGRRAENAFIAPPAGISSERPADISRRFRRVD